MVPSHGVWSRRVFAAVALIVIAVFSINFLSESFGATWAIHRELWVRVCIGVLGPIEVATLVLYMNHRPWELRSASYFLLAVIVIDLAIAIAVAGLAVI
jgi:hypothetical protein